MKNLKTIFANSLFVAVATLALSASAQSDRPGFMTVVRVEGLASYSLGDNNWRPLLPGKTLPAGAVIRTGENGVIDAVLGKAIEFPQSQKTPDRISPAPDSPVRGLISYKPSAAQNVIRLTPNSKLAIDKLTTTDTEADTVSDTELDLQQGRIFASVKKLSATSQYLVKVPNGIAGVRGTEFTMSADGATAVFSSGNGGLVISLSIGGIAKTILVPVGQVLNPSTGDLIPISSDLHLALSGAFDGLKTFYQEVVNYQLNHNNGYISSVAGTVDGTTTVGQ
jgi:hypothetical protein